MRKILVVEDETTLREMYAEKLNREGFEVISTIDAKQGIEIVKKEKPDLVLLDMLLPEENGIYFLKQLRTNSKISKTKVLVFSNYDGIDIKKEAEKWKIEDYLIKTNYTPNEVIQKIKKYLKL